MEKTFEVNYNRTETKGLLRDLDENFWKTIADFGEAEIDTDSIVSIEKTFTDVMNMFKDVNDIPMWRGSDTTFWATVGTRTKLKFEKRSEYKEAVVKNEAITALSQAQHSRDCLIALICTSNKGWQLWKGNGARSDTIRSSKFIVEYANQDPKIQTSLVRDLRNMLVIGFELLSSLLKIKENNIAAHHDWLNSNLEIEICGARVMKLTLPIFKWILWVCPSLTRVGLWKRTATLMANVEKRNTESIKNAPYALAHFITKIMKVKCIPKMRNLEAKDYEEGKEIWEKHMAKTI